MNNNLVMSDFIPFIIGFLFGGIVLIPFMFKSNHKNNDSCDNVKDENKSKVKVRITYDNIRKMYLVYYNGYCQKGFYEFEDAKIWSENNIENYIKGIEVKYEREY